ISFSIFLYISVLVFFLYIPISFTLAEGEKLRPGAWNRIKGTMVALKDETLLDKVMKRSLLPREKGQFLFQTGESFSYTYKAEALQLMLGKKVTTIAKDTTLNIPCLYPEAKNPIDIPFRFLPVTSSTSTVVYYYQSKSAMVFPFGKSEIVFLDWNHNGYFDDFNEDRYCIVAPNTFQKKAISPEEWKKLLQVFPGFIKFPNDETYLVGIKPAWEVFLWKVSNNLKPDYLTHMGYLNHLRKMQGVGFVGLEESLIPACEKHCSYCSLHGIGHEEDPAKEGYSPEGNRAGTSSVVGGSRTDAVDGLKGMVRTLYHRNPFLVPGLRKVSLGCKDGIYVCDVNSFSDFVVIKPILYPFPRQADVDVRASGESPNQFPDDITGAIGTIIAIRFPVGKRPQFYSATIRQTQTNEEVPFAYTDPHKVPQEARKQFPTNEQCICLFPRKHLDKGVIYEVTITYYDSPADASKNRPPHTVKWQFKTEEPPPAEPEDG
ncbi:MAG: hypothetical protein QME51_03690, partial [Planctomycetota bacterium]|nr:hypothetical protein [Planctomycetota bacterium]